MSTIKIKNKLLILTLAIVLAIGVVPTDVFAFEANNERISANNLGNYGMSISADGRYVAFVTYESLIVGDTNGENDVYITDRVTNITTRVSEGGTSGSPIQGNGYSNHSPSLSADGRYVAFESDSTNLVAGDTNTYSDIFVMDRDTHTLTRVSEGGTSGSPVEGNGQVDRGVISGNGRYVAFSSDSSNITAGDSNFRYDVFVMDRDTHTVTRVSEGGTSGTPIEGNSNVVNTGSVSDDGRFVAFTSYATNLVPGDINGPSNVFVMDRDTHTLTRVSEGGTSGSPIEGNSYSYGATMSSDGRYVAFYSDATNLINGDTNGFRDVFVMDRDTHTVTRVNEGGTSGSPIQANGYSSNAVISGDGRYVSFFSSASNLTTGDTNSFNDVFIADRNSHTLKIVSEGGTSGSPVQGNGNAVDGPIPISADGRYAVFASRASNLIAGDTNSQPDIFVSGNVQFDDEDGVANNIEIAAPNEGDANNDGVGDILQQTVTSLVSSTNNEYVVLESGNCTTNTSVSLDPETSNSQQDGDYSYPAGLLNFTLTGCTVGATETITQYYYGTFDLANTVLRKYNSTTNQYATITGAVLSAVTIGGQSAIKAVYQVTDGGELDEDGIANGTIIDPAGIAVLGVSSPNTGFEQNSIAVPIGLIIAAGALVVVARLYVKSNARKK